MSDITTLHSSSSVEARLLALESKVGNPETVASSSVSTRLDALLSEWKRLAPDSVESSAELDRLSTLHYYKANKNAPFLMRLQEVLASSDTLTSDIEQLSTICSLLSISSSKKDDAKLREDQVTQAPIVTLPGISLEEERRLDVLSFQLADIKTRTDQVAARIDLLVDRHFRVMSTISSKTVLADEQVSAKE